jgi:hypothetical protein
MKASLLPLHLGVRDDVLASLSHRLALLFSFKTILRLAISHQKAAVARLDPSAELDFLGLPGELTLSIL